jgi:tetratricopeptide (TPR) repeat protein
VPQVLPEPISESPRRTVIPETACKICSIPYVEEEYEFPLCWDCRRRLSRREFPRVIKLVCALVLMAVVYAGTYYPETLRATAAYQLGQRAERARNFGRAIQEYQIVLETYPESPLALAHLGISYYRSGNTLQAIWVLGALWGKDNPKEVAHQVNDIFTETKRRAGVK